MALALLAAVLGAYTVYATREPARNKENGCPIGRHTAPQARTFVLVDQTDALPKSELDFARDLIRNEYFWLPINGVLTIRTISASVDTDVDTITVCRVKVGSEGNGITNNPVALDKQFRAMVGKRLDKFLADLEKTPVQPASPIAESVGTLFRRTDFGPDVKKRRVVILSDMAQYSRVFSQYGRSDRRRYQIPKALIEQYGSDMKGAEIRIQYVRRPSIRFQGERHREFWESYFRDQGADVALGHALALGEPSDRSVWHDDKM
ncbi:MAG: hypothetical protein H6921_01740 [Sphingomonas sp.]|nr:hypothetical protein [Sphingomonas sp.]